MKNTDMPNEVRVTITLPSNVHTRIKKRAEQERRNLNQQIGFMLEEFESWLLDQEKEAKPKPANTRSTRK